jgi:hypothetical protein
MVMGDHASPLLDPAAADLRIKWKLAAWSPNGAPASSGPNSLRIAQFIELRPTEVGAPFRCAKTTNHGGCQCSNVHKMAAPLSARQRFLTFWKSNSASAKSNRA